jgi:hypothetical protein
MGHDPRVSSETLVFKVPAAVSVPLLAAGPAVPAVPATEAVAACELAHPHEADVWWATGNEEPVFLDDAGRRRPLVLVAGAIAAAASAVWLAALVTGAIGFSSLPGSPAALPLSASSGSSPAPPAASIHAPHTVAAAARTRGRLALDVDHPRRRRDINHALRIVRV